MIIADHCLKLYPAYSHPKTGEERGLLMKQPVPENGLSARRVELVERICARVHTDGIHQTVIPSLYLIRETQPSVPMPTVYEPSLCLVLQGAKTVMLHDERYYYDASSYLIVSVHLPTKGQIVEAHPEKPYLCVKLTFSTNDILELLQDRGEQQGADTGVRRGLGVSGVHFELMDAVLRLVRLLDQPRDIPVLGPLISREILYRVLQDSQGALLRDLALKGSPAQRIAGVIGHIRSHYAASLSISELAKLAHMSESSLHIQFKALTAMTPLQYQKLIRLQEARRLLLSGLYDAADAGFQVGYGSPSQFSREYARQFGLPPISDLKRLKLELSEN